MSERTESRATQLHRKAMAKAHAADRLFEEAYGLERQAAELAGEEEPSRSILYKSAGWLAMSSREYEEAAEMAQLGLAGNPPEDVRADLEMLAEKAAKAMVGRL